MGVWRPRAARHDRKLKLNLAVGFGSVCATPDLTPAISRSSGVSFGQVGGGSEASVWRSRALFRGATKGWQCGPDDFGLGRDLQRVRSRCRGMQISASFATCADWIFGQRRAADGSVGRVLVCLVSKTEAGDDVRGYIWGWSSWPAVVLAINQTDLHGLLSRVGMERKSGSQSHVRHCDDLSTNGNRAGKREVEEVRDLS